MSFQLPRALLAKAVRPATRIAGRNVGRRAMSSGAHTSKPKSDLPWIVGSTAIFGSAAIYLLSPPGKEKAHEAKEAALPKHKIPDPDNAPVPTGNESEVAPVESEPVKSEATVSDDEGNKASASEVTDSMNKAYKEDAPKGAADAEAQPEKTETEEKGGSYNPDVAAHADTEHKEDSGALETSKKRPRDVGGARERAKDGLDPSTSADVDNASGEEDDKDEKSKKEPSQ